eukprot:719490-Hanusia_phi.AAC.4
MIHYTPVRKLDLPLPGHSDHHHRMIGLAAQRPGRRQRRPGGPAHWPGNHPARPAVRGRVTAGSDPAGSPVTVLYGTVRSERWHTARRPTAQQRLATKPRRHVASNRRPH